MQKAEQLVGGPVAQLFPFIGIDVTHHEGHIILGEAIEGSSFWKYPSDEFMSDFNAAFLVGTLRITVKYSGSASAVLAEFNGKRIRKFTTAVTIILNSA